MAYVVVRGVVVVVTVVVVVDGAFVDVDVLVTVVVVHPRRVGVVVVYAFGWFLVCVVLR